MSLAQRRLPEHYESHNPQERPLSFSPAPGQGAHPQVSIYSHHHVHNALWKEGDACVPSIADAQALKP